MDKRESQALEPLETQIQRYSVNMVRSNPEPIILYIL